MPHENSLPAQTSHRHSVDRSSAEALVRDNLLFCDNFSLPQQPASFVSSTSNYISKKTTNMAIKVFLFALICVACSQASPIRQLEEMTRPILVLPIFYVDEIRNVAPASVEAAAVEKESDETLTTTLEDIGLESVNVEKRSVEQGASSLEDLETAAGTNVLRPLFVYRQQVAYRQRIKDALRRENRF